MCNLTVIIPFLQMRKLRVKELPSQPVSVRLVTVVSNPKESSLQNILEAPGCVQPAPCLWCWRGTLILSALLTHTFSFRAGTKSVPRTSIPSDPLIFSSRSCASFWSCPFSKDGSTADREMTLLTSWATTLESSCELSQGWSLQLAAPSDWGQPQLSGRGNSELPPPPASASLWTALPLPPPTQTKL